MNIQLIALFLEGTLSFFSPCIWPIMPIYLTILGGQMIQENKQKNSFMNVTLFILGISATFFLLASTSSIVSVFFHQHRLIIKVISGNLIMLMGLFQLGLFKSKLLSLEYSAKNKLFNSSKKITPWVAFLMGFTFSFSWTPCVGPILASVFFYSSSQPWQKSFFLITIYCLGFILPFILLAIFSTKCLGYLRSKSHLIQYTSKISGFILILIGLGIIRSTI